MIRRADTFGLYIDITNNSTSSTILIEEIKLTTPNGFIKLDDESLERMNSKYNKTAQQPKPETNKSRIICMIEWIFFGAFAGIFAPYNPSNNHAFRTTQGTAARQIRI
ncbi:MAG: hypothetical protein ACJ72J_17505 [Nitrososphaeraceae archaeon]